MNEAPYRESEPNGLVTVRVEPTGDQGGPATSFCSNCRTDVVPGGRGHCPACGRFVPENSGALATGLRSKRLAKGVDTYRRDLLDQLFEERGGRDALDVVSRISIENYALVCGQARIIEARLDQDGLFTQTGRRRSAFDMLKGISETIERLRAELPPVVSRPPMTAALDNMPASALRLASALLARQVNGATLTERELGQLDVLSAAMRGRVSLPPDEREPSDKPPHIDAAPVIESNATADMAELPKGERPTCQFCQQSLDSCSVMRVTQLATWQTLHLNHPDEITRHRKETTAVMMHQLGRVSPYL